MRKKHGTASAGISEETAVNLGYYYSTVEAHLKSLSAQTSGADSVADIAHRLAQLLEATAVREQHGDSAMVSEMWPNGDSARTRVRAAFNNGFSTRQANVGAHGHRTLSAKAKRAISKAQRKRWARFYAKKDADRARWRKSKQGRRRMADPNLTAAGKPRKRILTPAQLESMRANAVKARAAKRKKKPAPMSAEQRAKISATMKAAFAAKAAGAA